MLQINAHSSDIEPSCIPLLFCTMVANCGPEVSGSAAGVTGSQVSFLRSTPLSSPPAMGSSLFTSLRWDQLLLQSCSPAHSVNTSWPLMASIALSWIAGLAQVHTGSCLQSSPREGCGQGETSLTRGITVAGGAPLGLWQCSGGVWAGGERWRVSSVGMGHLHPGLPSLGKPWVWNLVSGLDTKLDPR